MPARFPSTILTPAAGQGRRLRRLRRGYGSLLAMVVLAVFIGLLMMVVNYAFLAYSQLRTAEVTDTLARTAVSELLDEQLLEDESQTPSQGDDIADAEDLVQILLQELNDLAAENQHLEPGDITVTAGYVDDLRLPVTDSRFQTTPPPGTPFNTLRIAASRPTTGDNPLYLLVRGYAFPDAADIGSASYATLDSRLIGFRPSELANAPVAPIGILDTAWTTGRTLDENSNDRIELDGRLDSTTGGETNFNLVLLNFDSLTAPPYAQIEEQLENGLSPDDISGDFLGPIVPGVATLTVGAEKRSPTTQVNQLADTLEDIADSNEPRRVFPLYSTYNDGNNTAVLVGFVAAQVLRADVVSGPTTNEDQLQVILEPAFIVHFTAETAREFNSTDVPENVYIHKIRLSR